MMKIMNILTHGYAILCGVTLCIGFTIGGGGDPTARVTVQSIKVDVTNNPYFGQWSCEVHEPGDTISCKVPVKKDLPAEMMMKATIEFDGSTVTEVDTSICDAFDDEAFGKDILEAGEPKGKFPKECPVKANGEYIIKKYKFPREKIQPGIPDGKVIMNVVFYEGENPPYATLDADADLTHDN